MVIGVITTVILPGLLGAAIVIHAKHPGITTGMEIVTPVTKLIGVGATTIVIVVAKHYLSGTTVILVETGIMVTTITAVVTMFVLALINQAGMGTTTIGTGITTVVIKTVGRLDLTKRLALGQSFCLLVIIVIFAMPMTNAGNSRHNGHENCKFKCSVPRNGTSH